MFHCKMTIDIILQSNEVWQLFTKPTYVLSLYAVYIEMIDLLREFDDPAVMDIKIGTRYVQYMYWLQQVVAYTKHFAVNELSRLFNL